MVSGCTSRRIITSTSLVPTGKTGCNRPEIWPGMAESDRLHDIAIIGGGIVGLATAYEITRRYPGKSVVLLEKEATLAGHQTGHNSGVIHSGVYYKPGSAKARTCLRGGALLRQFCDANSIHYDECGKI